jgi:hypothetical protein
MKQSELQKELDKFKNFVISESQKNLRKLGKDGGKLYDSIEGRVKANPNSFEMEFSMEEYGLYQDKGVSGTEKKYNTPFKYKTGKKNAPPPRAFDKWAVRKGLAPRTKSGKFASRKSLQFALSRFIQKNGIKPSLFFTRPFEKAYKKLPQDLVDAFGVDAIKLFNESIYLTKK